MTTLDETNNRTRNVTPVCTARSDTTQSCFSNQIESVKRQIFHQHQETIGENEQALRLALFEADVLARQTGYPELLFPSLAEEKVRNAARRQFRQHYLLGSNSSLALSA